MWWGEEMAQIAAQQRAHRLAQLAAQRDAQLRAESFNRTAEQLRPPTQWQLTANSKADEAAPIPEDVAAQLDQTRGRFGQWLPTKYGAAQLEHWRQNWLITSVVGKEVAAEIAAKEEQQQQAQLAAALAARQQQIAEQAEREHQELLRLPEGTVVRISMPRTQLEGRIGRVKSMELVGNQLMAQVMVEAITPDSPWWGKPPSYRPIHLMPQLHQVPAAQLTKEHPEAME